MVSARNQRPAPYSVPSSECSIPIRRTINYHSGEEDLRPIRVQDMRFNVSPQFLQAGSPVFKAMLKEPKSLIVLSGHTAAQFRAFLWAVYTQPLPGATTLGIARLCSIAEVSFKYEFNSLKIWSMEGINALIGSPDTLLRTAKSETFVRLVRLALLYHDWDLCRSVVSRWLSRLHWHSISPAPAIVLADAFNLRQLLCHAYYVHLVNVAPRIARSLPIDAGSPLNSTQNVHVLCGYHSLLASWRQLQEAPPTFTAAATCASHPRCLIAWTARWALETGRSTALPPVDLLRRLFVMEENLTADEVLRECMGSECKLRALEAITRKRAEISDNLHHHFDL